MHIPTPIYIKLHIIISINRHIVLYTVFLRSKYSILILIIYLSNYYIIPSKIKDLEIFLMLLTIYYPSNH